MKHTVYILFLLCSFQIEAQHLQDWEGTEVSPMPEPVSNNAVTQGFINGSPYVFSFGGIDSTKIWSGIHLRSFRYDVNADSWDTIPSLPDTMGKIAAGASTVKNKIYIIGGYHVLQNGSEVSSDKVHIYDPETNTYLADGAPIPIPIDDHVQAVWKDSLIFVVTGWSNTQNVPNVQIYNPSTDTWSVGTSVPNSNLNAVFGASGVIIEDTIFYSGGAAYATNFPPSVVLRKGYINPNNPTDISWVTEINPLAKGYRMAVGTLGSSVFWFGGSSQTYNYDGIAYDGSGGVEPSKRVLQYDSWDGQLIEYVGYFPSIMDLRGIGGVSYNPNDLFYQFIIAGGMTENQQVTNKTFLLKPIPISTHQQAIYQKIDISPNPAQSYIQIDGIQKEIIKVFNIDGKIVLQQPINNGETISVENLPNGVYQVLIEQNNEFFKGRFVIMK